MHWGRIVLKNLADTSAAELLFGHVAACFPPKGLWYEQSFRSTAAESVQTGRRQTAHFEFQSDPPTHGHEVDGQLDDRGFQEGRQRRCQLDEGDFEEGCHRWCLTSQVTRRRPPTNVGVRRQRRTLMRAHVRFHEFNFSLFLQRA